MKISGGPELLALLEQLPAKIGRNVVRGGARAAAGVVRDEARALVRKESGALARSLKLSTQTSVTIVTAKVRAKGRHAFLAPFIEYGVAAHVINGRPLKIGEGFVSGPVDHPGFAAAPFMRPALDTKAAEAIGVMGQYIRARLTWGALSAPALVVEPDEE